VYRVGAFLIAALCFSILAQQANAAYTRQPQVRIFSNQQLVQNFLAYDSTFDGGTQVALGDLQNDGTPEIVTAPGAGGGPQIRILQSDGKLIGQFFAYDQSLRSGVNIAVGDLDADGEAEIITVPRSGAASHVRVFNVHGQPKLTPGFFAFSPEFRGGANLAVGDYNGDGFGEIIVGAGTGGGPQVRIFDRFGKPVYSFFAFHKDFKGGVSVASGNVDGGTQDEIIVGVYDHDTPMVKVIKVAEHETLISQFIAFDKKFTGGVEVNAGDTDGDGFDEVIVAARSGGGPQVRAFEGSGLPSSVNFFSYEKDFRGGVSIATGDMNGDGVDDVITAPQSWVAEGKPGIHKYVEVSIAKQHLWAYEDGRVVRDFAVSTGLPGYDTRPGNFSITQKTYSKDYFGPGYYFPNTLWNMRFDGSRLLHGAYWHNNFGRKKSHGCINLPYPQAEWLYNWSSIGTPVFVTAQ
jgi:hypothetical protein